jgi:hypothetical protein
MPRVALEHRAEQAPVEEPRHVVHGEAEEDDRRDRAFPVGEQVGAHPGNETLGLDRRLARRDRLEDGSHV